MICYLLLLVRVLTLDAVEQFPGLVEVEAGGAVRLRCSTNGMPATYCYTIIWARIDPITKKLASFMNTASFGDRGATEQTECPFDIKNATVDDSGTYYCLVVYGKMVYIGNGSNVVVSQVRKTSLPQIEILRPTGYVHGSFISLLCMIPGVIPQPRMFWVIDGQEKSGYTESIWTKDSEEIMEATQNQVVVPAEQWERGAECTCVVEFEGRRTSKSVKNGDYWEVCYATVVPYRVVVTVLCLLSWIVAITVASCYRRKKTS